MPPSRSKFALRIMDIPAQLLLDFPENLPLPPPKVSAVLLGGALHVLHFCVRLGQIQGVPDSDLGWEDMYMERDGESWFDWVCPLVCQRSLASFILSAVRQFQ